MFAKLAPKHCHNQRTAFCCPFRSGIISGMCLTSPPSTALEGGLKSLATPLVSSPAVPEPRRNARRFSESAFSTSSTHEHIVPARSRSLASIDAPSSSCSSPARALAREGVASAPGRGEGGRCCATEQGTGETSPRLTTVACEQRGGRVCGAAKDPARSVSGGKGLIPAVEAADDRPPKVTISSTGATTGGTVVARQ